MLPVIFGLDGTDLTPEERAFFADARPAGFILFGRNIGDRGQLRVLRNWAPSRIDQEKVRLLLEFHPELAALQDVPDPYYSDAATFDRVLGMIERSTQALFRQLAPALRQGIR